jgi:hypothetical protein
MAHARMGALPTVAKVAKVEIIMTHYGGIKTLAHLL